MPREIGPALNVIEGAAREEEAVGVEVGARAGFAPKVGDNNGPERIKDAARAAKRDHGLVKGVPRVMDEGQELVDPEAWGT